jgi:Ca-activated chloride channel family protein
VTFAWPLGLVALLVVPLAAAAYVWAQRRPPRYAVNYTNVDVLASVATAASSWRRYVAPAIFLLALTALALAASRPNVTVDGTRENATVVLVIDTSGSMMADDVAPTRMQAAQSALRTFLRDLPVRFRVGAVAFSAEPQVIAPVTRDRALVRESLDFLVPLRGTAIGDAIARATELAAEAIGRRAPGDPFTIAYGTPIGDPDGNDPSRSPAAILLLSDGAQTVGELTPDAASEQARALGIPVYTIALGTPEGELQLEFGGVQRTIPVPPDRPTLRRIAETTGGKFFDAPSAEALSSAYEELDSLLSTEPEPMEATFAFLGAAAVLLVLAGVLSAAWSGRLP